MSQSSSRLAVELWPFSKSYPWCHTWRLTRWAASVLFGLGWGRCIWGAGNICWRLVGGSRCDRVAHLTGSSMVEWINLTEFTLLWFRIAPGDSGCVIDVEGAVGTCFIIKAGRRNGRMAGWTWVIGVNPAAGHVILIEIVGILEIHHLCFLLYRLQRWDDWGTVFHFILMCEIWAEAWLAGVWALRRICVHLRCLISSIHQQLLVSDWAA